MPKHFISVKKVSTSLKGKCLYFDSRGSRSGALCWREITPNNRLGHCCSVVYTAHGMGISTGTLSNGWNPETQFPLPYVIDEFLRLQAHFVYSGLPPVLTNQSRLVRALV